MAKRSRTTNERTMGRRLQEERGQGKGSAYKPWLTIQDVPSQGLSHRIKGWTTGRVHHLLSNLERDVFYLLDWSEQVLDIREQYPLLPLEETEAIAEHIGVRHPIDPRTRHPVVMTTDFLLDASVGNITVHQARSVKPAEQLGQLRTLEKLEIERRYWQVRGVDWGVITEHEIPIPQTDTIRLLHGYRHLQERLASDIQYSEVIQFLLDKGTLHPVGDLLQACDSTLQLPDGTALTVLYYLLATRQLAFNLAEPFTERSRLALGKVVQA